MKEVRYPKAYGRWAGNRAGVAPNYERCCVEVRGFSLEDKQCSRKCGHGPDGAYCKQHDPAVVAAKQDASMKAFYKKLNSKRYGLNGRSFFIALTIIAAGHNNARAFAQSIIDEFEKGEMK